MMQLRPMVFFLNKVLDQLVSKDQGEIFAEPVDISEVNFCFDFQKKDIHVKFAGS